jgi:hypothetical protein
VTDTDICDRPVGCCGELTLAWAVPEVGKATRGPLPVPQCQIRVDTGSLGAGWRGSPGPVPGAQSAWRYRGQLAADLVCLGSVQLAVQGECLLPVVAGLLVLASRVVAFGQVAVRGCLLVGVAGFVR